MTHIDSIRPLPFIAGTAATLALLTGCSSAGSAPPSGSTPGRSSVGETRTLSPSGTTSGSQPPASTSSEAATGAVAAAYRGYWAARVKAQAAPQRPAPAELDRYAIGTARTDVKASVLRFRQQGIAFRGRPVLSPGVIVTRWGSAGADGAASIADCVDSSHWTPVFVATGRSALVPGQPLRVVVTSTARQYEGRWVIDTSVARRDRPC